TQVSSLAQTVALAEEARFAAAADALMRAKRVFCFGQGNSLVIAMIAWSRFISVSKKFYCVGDAHLQSSNAALCDAEDVILYFSYSGSTRDMMDILPTAHKNGAKIILVTRFENSPAAQFSDTVLLCGSNEGPLQVGSMAAKAAQLMVIDILFNSYWMCNEKECEEHTQATAQMIARKLL
ncbi:MAG: SIS domain-containing protein, partial [Ruthenibacterium sp.]